MLTSHEAILINDREVVGQVLNAMEKYKNGLHAASERTELEVVRMIKNREDHIKEISEQMS